MPPANDFKNVKFPDAKAPENHAKHPQLNIFEDSTLVDDHIIHAVAREVKQVEQIVHALGVFAGEQEKCKSDALCGERFEQLQRV